ncbi:NAD-dependent epimerase/dehydratase family protein [Sulfitobacter sp. PS-8MA]|uniref:NAD-dependent epimerase/dehydratase family protein n=1 Tax=Sulfitobacter sp. PS-8MA TaxID=3237707 RepID=UPI0034C5F353
MREDAALHLISQRPGSLYAISKLASEQIGLLYRDLHGLDTISLRLGAVVGGDTSNPTSVPGRLFSTLINAAGTGEEITLDDPLLIWKGPEEFVDVRDCARAAVAALDAEKPRTGVYNITHPTQWTLDAVIGAVAEAHGELNVKYDRTIETGFAGFAHVRPAGCDITAAREELGFSPAHDLKDSLRHWW